MLSSFSDPWGTRGGWATPRSVFDPFDDFGFGSPITTNWSNRRLRRRFDREMMKTYAPTWTPTVSDIERPFLTDLTSAGNALAPIDFGTGFLSPFTGFGPNVALFDFDRLLAEPLVLGLEDHPNEYRLHIRPQPLLRRRDCHVEVDKGVLTVSGERIVEQFGRTRSASFSRSVTIPSNVNQDKIEAKYNDDGTLDVKLPKTAGTERKRILIKTGSEAAQAEAGSGKEEEKKTSGKEQENTNSGTEKDIKIG